MINRGHRKQVIDIKHNTIAINIDNQVLQENEDEDELEAAVDPDHTCTFAASARSGKRRRRYIGRRRKFSVCLK